MLPRLGNRTPTDAVAVAPSEPRQRPAESLEFGAVREVCGVTEELQTARPSQSKLLLARIRRRLEECCDAGAFSEQPTRDEISEVTTEIWGKLTRKERSELKHDLCSDGGVLLDFLDDLALQIVDGRPDRPHRKAPMPARQPVILDDARQRAIDAAKGRKISRQDIKKVMQRYWKAQAPVSQLRLKELLDDAGFSDQQKGGIGSLVDYAVHELDKLELLKERENIWYPGKKNGPPSASPPKGGGRSQRKT